MTDINHHPQAFLVVGVDALYNDEYTEGFAFDGFTGNPRGIFFDEAEAQAHALTYQRQELRGQTFHLLPLGERSFELDGALGDEIFARFGEGWGWKRDELSGNAPIPESATDAELDELATLLDIQFYRIVSASVEDEAALAQARLDVNGTTELPEAWPDQPYGSPEDREAAARLDRALKLFGLSYSPLIP